MSQTEQAAKAPLRLPSTIFLTVTPLLALTLVPWYGFTVGFDAFEWCVFAVFMFMSGIAITAGYHRLWSHKAYEVHPVIRFIYAVWGACAVQNSIIHWASDHRNHHRHVDDNDRDPYSARRGFWFSHIGWIMRKHVSGQDDFSNVKDLLQDPIVRWQHKYYAVIATVMNIGLPVLIGYVYGNVWGTLLLAGLLRLVLNHHFTFAINSLAHIWGSQTYSDKNTARDNGFLALLTYGEGYHNYHHRFQYDFRNGIRWWHFDPSKWIIICLNKIGLAHRLKSPSKEQIEKSRLETQYRRMLKKLEEQPRAGEWHERLEHAYQQLHRVLEEFSAIKKEWQRLKSEKLHGKTAREHLKKKYDELRASLKAHRRHWRALIVELA